MQILVRRLYNGGFNHLKRASSLLYRAPHIVAAHPPAVRFCATNALEINNDSVDGHSPLDNAAHRCLTPTSTAKMSAHLDFVKANEEYAADFGDKGKLPIPPSKKLAIVTCMDARINVYAQLDIKEGEAHIIRNAGGVAKDALRSIIISQRLLGTREIAVIHHTGCGMTSFSTPQLRTLVKESDPQDSALAVVDDIDFLEFKDTEQSVKDDVAWLRTNALLLKETPISGWVYDVETGKIQRVV